MPHITLEYTDNLVHKLNVTAFFADLHRALGEFEGIVVADLKSRALCHERYFFGDPKAVSAFAHLELKLLSGRDISVRRRLVDIGLKILGDHLDPVGPPGPCPLSVEVREMDRGTYSKG